MPLTLKKQVASSEKKSTKSAAKAPAKGKAEAPVAEKKQVHSATQEEIDAAVAGKLAPRETPGSKKQDFAARNEGDRPAGRPLGVSLGLPIMLTWCYVFQQNEQAPKGEKMTDEEIAKFMHSEFPGRETNAFENVQYCRRLYNQGRFTKNVPPKVVSHRYDGDGNEDDPGTRTERREAQRAAEKVAAPAKKGVSLKKKTVKA